jgi:alpha-glucosidase (family GH31 glycosyl hydrolase)
MEHTIICGNMRVQMLSADIIRIEYDENKEFCDENTFFVPCRSRMEGFDDYTIDEEEGEIRISFDGLELYLSRQASSLAGIRLTDQEDKILYEGKRGRNSGELPPLCDTPQVFALYDTPRILVPEGGYAWRGDVPNDGYRIKEDVQDVYLLLCRKDAQKLRRLYVELTGRNEMVRLAVLGAWDSRFYEYSEDSAKSMIDEFIRRDIPLDNLVLDTDWRAASERGIGYDINTGLFPDMKRFLDYAHGKNVEIMFNDHPEPVEGAESVLDGREVNYREEKLQSLLALGLDTWWYDRNWITSLISPTKELKAETWGLAIFHDVTENFYKKKAGGDSPVRPVIMGNVNNIVNGIYREIMDSASHRYSIQWTGDNCCDRESIGNEILNILKAGNNAIGYPNFDCGGHLGNPDRELYLRWIQCGALSPVFRPHCTKGLERYREPWEYGDPEVVEIARRYYKLRYRLLPVLYKSARENYESGVPICRALGWNYPQDEKALAVEDAFMLGGNLLAAPVYGGRFERLPKEWYKGPVQAVYYNGTRFEGEPLWEKTYDSLNLYFDRISPGGDVPVYEYCAVFETCLLCEEDVDLIVEANDGLRVKIDAVQTYEAFFGHSALLQNAGILTGGKCHQIRIEYCQYDQVSCVSLWYRRRMGDLSGRRVYLPEGEWMNLFDGTIHAGAEVCRTVCDYDTMPLFARLGGVIPLAEDAQTTKEQQWDWLTLDFYPSRKAGDKDYLYEDDGRTTAYKDGEYRKTPVEAGYDAESGRFYVTVGSAEGEFKGDKCFFQRTIAVRFHLLPGAENVRQVLVNGVETPFTRLQKDERAFPLKGNSAAADSDVILVESMNSVSRETRVEFVLTGS